MGQTRSASFLKGPRPPSAGIPSSLPAGPSLPDSSHPIFAHSSSQTPISSPGTYFCFGLLRQDHAESPPNIHFYISHPSWAQLQAESPSSLAHFSCEASGCCVYSGRGWGFMSWSLRGSPQLVSKPLQDGTLCWTL